MRLQGSWGLSVWTLHVVPSSLWVFSSLLTERAVGLNMNGCLSFYVPPAVLSVDTCPQLIKALACYVSSRLPHSQLFLSDGYSYHIIVSLRLSRYCLHFQYSTSV